MDYKKEYKDFKDKLIGEIKKKLSDSSDKVYHLTPDDEAIVFRDYYFDGDFYVPYRLTEISLASRGELDLIFIDEEDSDTIYPEGGDLDLNAYENTKQYRFLFEGNLSVEQLIQILEYFD